MTTRNTRIRFCDNNMISTDNATASTASSTYPFANAFTQIRSQTYRPTSNSSQTITIDLGTPYEVTFFGIFGKIDEDLGITSEADITLEGNNINDFI